MQSKTEQMLNNLKKLIILTLIIITIIIFFYIWNKNIFAITSMYFLIIMLIPYISALIICQSILCKGYKENEVFNTR